MTVPFFFFRNTFVSLRITKKCTFIVYRNSTSLNYQLKEITHVDTLTFDVRTLSRIVKRFVLDLGRPETFTRIRLYFIRY